MLAYRHSFHAGNHGDVLKHLVLLAVLKHLQAKDKGLRIVDTHAGAGAYRLAATGPRGRPPEWHDGIGRLWPQPDAPAPDDAPPLVADLLAQVRGFNGPGALKRYPGSPRLVRAWLRPQDEMRLFELHPTDATTLVSSFRGDTSVRVERADGFAALAAQLPSPTRRALVLIDPSYERKTDYGQVLVALRQALARMAETVLLIWLPQVALREAAELPRRLLASAATAGRSALHAGITVGAPDARGFGMSGSSVVVVNAPHTLAAGLDEALPWLASALAQSPRPSWFRDGD